MIEYPTTHARERPDHPAVIELGEVLIAVVEPVEGDNGRLYKRVLRDEYASEDRPDW